MNKKQYFQLITTGNIAEIYIYGDISACPQDDGVSAASLSMQLAALQGVKQINVYINSYGGDVSEGVAIYNALKRHSAKIVTYCDGMACSIASVIFMAGDERIMCNPSFLMIHDAWTYAAGNAEDFRKAADDMDVITTASISAYMAHCKISEQELREKMHAETWLTHTQALEMGFATGIMDAEITEKPAQNAKMHAFELFMKAIKFKNIDEDDAREPSVPQNEPEVPDDKPDSDEDSDGKDGNPEPQEPPENDDEDKKEQVSTPAQQWSGFFNALISMKNERMMK